MNNLYGSPVMTLAKVVKNLMIEQGNSNQNHYADNLVRAGRTFKDLLKDTVYSLKYKALKVDPSDGSVTMPQDIVRLININVVNHCGDLVPLACNPDMNTLKLECPKTSCGCTSCSGNGTLCDALDAIQVINEEVLINGYPFNKKTWIQKCNDGIIRKVIELPYPDLPYPVGVAPTVTYVTEYENLCTLEVTGTNCIKSTEGNHRLLMQHCGCYIPSWQSRMCGYLVAMNPLSPAMNTLDANPHGLNAEWMKNYWCENDYFPQSNFGYWNWGVNAHDKMFFKMIRTDTVIICYQTNGENCDGDEILVPEYALDAMQFGIVYRQRAWSPAFNKAEKESSRQDYNRAKFELKSFLSPVSPETIAGLQDLIPLW